MKMFTILSIAIISFGNGQTKTSETSNSAQHNQGHIVFNNLLNAFNQTANDVVVLFDQKAIIEFPYAPSLGTPNKLNLNEYHDYLKSGLAKIPDIRFENIRLYEVTKNTYWAEVHGSVRIPSTGKLYQQDYVMYFTLKAGKIDFYREYWNPIAAIEAFGNPKAIKETFN